MSEERGAIYAHIGPMFSGKTDELIAQAKVATARYGSGNVVVYRPSVDTRNEDDTVSSHSGCSVKCNVIEPDEHSVIANCGAKVALIDEAQFFDDSLYRSCLAAKINRCIILAFGLNLDFAGDVFPAMENVVKIADRITKLYAKCAICGAPAWYSRRIVPGDSVIMIGGSESYTVVCEAHRASGLCDFSKLKGK